MPKRRALIIGGSLGGLIAAHLLRSVGWDAVVFERNTVDLPSRGAGIGTHSHLIEVLRRIGIPFDDSMGVRVRHVICLARDGTVVLEKPTERLMSGWARLYHSLRGPLPPECYRLGCALDRVEQGHDGVTAVFADGAQERGDLLVGADGFRSTVRSQFLPELQPLVCGLRRLAGDAGGARRPARHPRRDFRVLHVLPAGGRAAASAIRFRVATTTPRPAAAPTISYGIARPIPRPRWSICAPMWPAGITACRLPRR